MIRVKENRVEIHEDGEVGEVIAGTLGMRLVGGDKAAAGRRPMAEDIGIRSRGGVIPKHATD